jgi:hypothetical protein
VVMVTLITGMFLLFTCTHSWMWGILRRQSACVPTAHEMVRDGRNFEKHCEISGSHGGEYEVSSGI